MHKLLSSSLDTYISFFVFAHVEMLDLRYCVVRLDFSGFALTRIVLANWYLLNRAIDSDGNAEPRYLCAYG